MRRSAQIANPNVTYAWARVTKQAHGKNKGSMCMQIVTSKTKNDAGNVEVIP